MFLGSVLQEAAELGMRNDAWARRVRPLLDAAHFSRADADQAEYGLGKLSAKALRGKARDAFVDALTAAGLTGPGPQKAVKNIPAKERTPERLVHTLIEPHVDLEWTRADRERWEQVEREPGVGEEARGKGEARLFALAPQGDWVRVVALSDAQRQLLDDRHVETTPVGQLRPDVEGSHWAARPLRVAIGGYTPCAN